ncbi:MAG: hypothetical protein OES13_00110 [Acidimicrobiia bacterium]|nr:hypothetical protein [Acidimicrobiia bacterium]
MSSDVGNCAGVSPCPPATAIRPVGLDREVVGDGGGGRVDGEIGEPHLGRHETHAFVWAQIVEEFHGIALQTLQRWHHGRP